MSVLAGRGWRRDDLAKLAGENLLRVMHEVEKVAAELQKTHEPEDRWLEDVDSHGDG